MVGDQPSSADMDLLTKLNGHETLVSTGQYKAPAHGMSVAEHVAWLEPALLDVSGDNILK